MVRAAADVDPISLLYVVEDKPLFITVNNNINKGDDMPVYSGNMMRRMVSGSVECGSVQHTYSNNMLGTVHNIYNKPKSHIGRYIAIIITILTVLCIIDKHIEDKAYYHAYHMWYTDQISDTQFQSMKAELNWR